MHIRCASVDDCQVEESETISSVIGIAGALSGKYVLRCGERTAGRIAEVLTGVELKFRDGLVKDAMGEICNMVDGAWKGSRRALPPPAAVYADRSDRKQLPT